MRIPGGIAFLAAIGLAIAGGGGTAAGADSLAVARLDARFPRGVDGGSLPGRIDLSVDFSTTAASTGFDPAKDNLRVLVGPVVLIKGPAFPGRTRVGRHGSWDVAIKVRGAYDGAGHADFRMTRASGRVEVKARGVDLLPLLAAGPSGIRVAIEVGSEVFETTLDLDGTDDRRWVLPGPDFVPPDPGILDGAAFTWTPVLAGGTLAILPSQRLVIRDQASFDAVLFSMFGGPVPAAFAFEPVDFSKEMVLGAVEPAALPGRSVLGITNIVLGPSGLSVGLRICQSVPGVDMPPVSVFAFARVTRGDWPVAFYKTTVPVCYD